MLVKVAFLFHAQELGNRRPMALLIEIAVSIFAQKLSNRGPVAVFVEVAAASRANCGSGKLIVQCMALVMILKTLCE